MYQKSDRHLTNLAKARAKAKTIQVACRFCSKSLLSCNIRRHERACYLNPNNLRPCPVCSVPIKQYREALTCSTSCANTLLRTGVSNPNWKESAYVTTCFHYHAKKCAVCDETRIVEVHHLDHNRENNSPDNLIPLCPTHHKYWHSRFRVLIEDAVYAYLAKWKKAGSA